MAKGGRPPRYATPEAMQEVIDAYFEKCRGRVLTKSDGSVVYDKRGKPVVVDERPPTMTGLALALGFNSRQSLLNYKARGEFLDTTTRARSLVEQATEERLFDKDGVHGARFSLANNFDGWKEKLELAADEKKPFAVNITVLDEGK